jgi:hypothetical protein
MYQILHDTNDAWRAPPVEKSTMKLDNLSFRRRRGTTVNPNTHQKIIFCARLHPAVGLALCIFPGQPGAAS